MSDLHCTSGQNSYHNDVEVLHADLKGTEKQIIMWCHECETEYVANIDTGIMRADVEEGEGYE